MDDETSTSWNIRFSKLSEVEGHILRNYTWHAQTILRLYQRVELDMMGVESANTNYIASRNGRSHAIMRYLIDANVSSVSGRQNSSNDNLLPSV